MARRRRLVVDDLGPGATQALAESATGCYENPAGIGTPYAEGGTALTKEQARAVVWAGRTVELPNAGAGSYGAVFVGLLGFDEVRVIEQSSSAGDWTFGVRNDDAWLPAFQSNRHPYHGFSYSVDFGQPARTFDSLCRLLSS